ncbi:MAG: DUF3825 domain-containing protein [Atopobiaceae bacterium]|nr:DUF3825 domain-containing protein [Atopobiaceae bacterium]
MWGTVYVRDGFTDELTDFAYIPQGTAGHLARKIGGGDAVAALRDSWAVAKKNGLVVDKGDAVTFPIWKNDAERESGTLPEPRMIATLKPNKNENPTAPWAIAYAGPDSWKILTDLEDDTITPRDIQDFAFRPWDRVLSEVSHRALDEPWDFGNGDKRILKSYLTYTYQRLSLQGKVAVDSEQGLAAFNTGLVTSTYDELFMCFSPNNRNRPDWRYAGICVAGERGLGKSLVDSFKPLPARVTYIDDVDDLIFDNTQELYVDDHHVVVDNIDRLPVGFLRDQLYDRPQILEELERIEAIEYTNRHDYDVLRDALEDDPELMFRLKNRLGDAVKLAQKRTQWNYRTAVPCYFPTANEMSLLLPLCLKTPTEPDAALVVSVAATGSYQGETILTMQMAYLDARLICRPENDWLVPEQ